ncbi:MAG: hypothetical protein WD795_17630 [Woeseia sp.]
MARGEKLKGADPRKDPAYANPVHRMQSIATNTANSVSRAVSPQLAGVIAAATADDLSAAARDLGLTEDEVAACRNP